MSIDVLMPQMGESIAEGTIVRWIKAVGDRVERDEPLFEISTDKVDAEIPSPAAGLVAEIRAKEGETVPVNSVVAVIAPAGTVLQPPQREVRATESPAAPTEPATAVRVAPQPAPPSRESGVPLRESAEAGAVRRRSSPLVRRIAKEHHVNIGDVPGTGMGGRVTRDDILAFIARASTAGPIPRRPESPDVAALPAVAAGVGLAGQAVPLSVMRRKIAEHMVASRRTSAHVHSVFEVNFDQVDRARLAQRTAHERSGSKLTYLSFIVSAAAEALRAVPVVNASLQDDKIVYHEGVNIGIAVALDYGLIVPVVRDAHLKSLLDLSRTIADLARRARAKQLKPEEVTGGTFTVTNPGAFGALFGLPIINQPQVAILGVGAVEKRPVVVNDAIAIRPTAHLALGFDHRIIDGAVADAFMSRVKRTLEEWDPSRA